MYRVVTNTISGKQYYQNHYNIEVPMYDLECDNLPPYVDLAKARSCYYENEKWVYDETHYNEIIDEQIRLEQDLLNESRSTSSNKELTDAIAELGEIVAEMLG